MEIFVAKISQKKYNGAILYKVYKKRRGYMENCYIFVYPVCPVVTRSRDIQNPAGLRPFGPECVCTFKHASRPQGLDGKGDDVNGNPTAGTY